MVPYNVFRCPYSEFTIFLFLYWSLCFLIKFPSPTFPILLSNHLCLDLPLSVVEHLHSMVPFTCLSSEDTLGYILISEDFELGTTDERWHEMCVFLVWVALLNMIHYNSVHLLPNFIFLYGGLSFQCVDLAHFHYLFFSWRIHRLFPFPSYSRAAMNSESKYLWGRTLSPWIKWQRKAMV